MKCQRCGKIYPGRKGRFCGACMPETIAIKGKNRQQCSRCKEHRMRNIWHTDCQTGKTERKSICLECDHIQEVQKIDRRVYSMFAPEDADYIQAVFQLVQNTIDVDRNGNREWVCSNLTELQQRLNAMPAHLRRKLDL